MLRSRVGVAVMKSRLYAIGGYNGTERLNTVEEFDAGSRVTNTRGWVSLPPIFIYKNLAELDSLFCWVSTILALFYLKIPQI